MTDSQSSLQAKNISILVTSLESCLTYGALIFESSGGYSLLIGLISEIKQAYTKAFWDLP